MFIIAFRVDAAEKAKKHLTPLEKGVIMLLK
jgi:hypothetical protein